MGRLDEFHFKKNLKEMESQDIAKLVVEGKTFQEIVGFSDETMEKFYETARQLYFEQRFEEAKTAFQFLTTINPYVSEFWLGLAETQQANQEYQVAISAYTMAIAMDPESIPAYLMAIECCLETQGFSQAYSFVKQALNYARSHPSSVVSHELRMEALKAQKNIGLAEKSWKKKQR